MVFSFLRRRRRAKLLAEPFPVAWDAFLLEGFPQFASLPVEHHALLRNRLRLFAAEKYWEGINGFAVTEEMRIVISAMACTLTLAFDDDDALFPSVSRVLLFPETISRQMRQRRNGLVVTEDEEWHLGEAWSTANSLTGGVIALAWTDVVRGAQNPNDGKNVVYHEFAHALDMADGAVEGTPPLASGTSEEIWNATLQNELNELRRQYDSGFGIPIDPYGLTNAAEFFAVSTESYLERPRLLQIKLPRLYELLDSFYQLRPAEW
jgi:Mlc titration factor MtfA (ptsG expression regulator)